MPAKINLDAQHDDIRKWVSECVPQEDIRARLLMEHNVRISSATMKLTLKRLGIRYNSRAPRIKTTPELKTRVAYMFNELRLSDEETVDMLRAEGFEVNLLRLRRLRREVGLFKRTVKSQAEDTDAMMRRVLQQELDDGVIQEMGRMHLYNYMRAKYNIHGRDRLYNVLRTLNPEAVDRRRRLVKGNTGNRSRYVDRFYDSETTSPDGDGDAEGNANPAAASRASNVEAANTPSTLSGQDIYANVDAALQGYNMPVWPAGMEVPSGT